MGPRLGCGCEPGGCAGAEGCGAGAAPVCLLMSWWFISRAEEGASLPPSVLPCVGSVLGLLGLLERAGCVWRGVSMAEGRAVGWVSCSSAGLGGRFGVWHRDSELFVWVWGAAVPEERSGEVLLLLSCLQDSSVPCLVIPHPRFCLLVLEGFHSAPLGPSAPYSRAGGSGRL